MQEKEELEERTGRNTENSWKKSKNNKRRYQEKQRWNIVTETRRNIWEKYGMFLQRSEENKRRQCWDVGTRNSMEEGKEL